MRAINILLAVLVSLTIGILVFEGGLRLIGLAPARSINQFDPVLGWSKEPGISVRKKSKEYDVTIEINDLGLREDPMTSPAKKDGVYRVVCLGDSFTLGYTVERENLFVDQLERQWRAQGRDVEVINAGTEGYSTDQEVLWLLENGEAYQPDLVLLFPYENDIYWNGQERYTRIPKPRFQPDGQLEQRALVDPGRGGWWSRTAIANVAKKFLGGGSEAMEFTPPGGSRKILKEFGVLLNRPPGFVTDAVTRTGGALSALKARCEELGSQLVVVPIPSHSAIDRKYATGFGGYLGVPQSDWSADLPVDTFLSLCQSRDIDSLDPREVLRQRTDAGEELYYKQDWHLNAAGNGVFSGWLLGELDAGDAAALPAATASAESVPPAAPAGKPARWPYVFGILWLATSLLYTSMYKDEPKWRPPLAIAGLLALIFTIVMGGEVVLAKLPPAFAQVALVLFVLGILGFVVYKLGRRVGTIAELLMSFTMRGHWYLMPLVVVLLTIGSLLVVAASSPLVAPFIYTLF